MKTERYGENGRFQCFGFPNMLIGKQGTIDALMEIPDLEVTYFSKAMGMEAFCDFTLNGLKFEVTEPYGDNSYYDITCELPNTPELERLYEHFRAIKLPVKAQRMRLKKYVVILCVGVSVVYIIKQL